MCPCYCHVENRIKYTKALKQSNPPTESVARIYQTIIRAHFYPVNIKNPSHLTIKAYANTSKGKKTFVHTKL